MHRSPLIVLLLLAGMLLAGCASASSPLRAERLRCEALASPLAIETTSPRLSWILRSSERGQSQSAYRVLVATSARKLARDEGDLWDSGRVESSDTVNIEYDGEPLAARRRCYWKLMSWDAQGVPGPWSEASAWEMGLLRQSDWRATWIDAAPNPIGAKIVSARYEAIDGREGADVTDRVLTAIASGEPIRATNETMGGDPSYGVRKRLIVEYEIDGAPRTIEIAEHATAPIPTSSIPYLRKGFVIDKPVASARLYATALGAYEMHLNGEPIGDHRMAPGWTDYNARVQYQTHDVTGLLSRGQNTLGAIVGPGWFSGRAGLFHIRAFYGDAPALLAQLEITYADGSRDTIVTDGTWRRCDGPILASDIMDGEIYDARREVPGWCDAGAASGSSPAWSPVALRAETRTLRAQSDQPVRVLSRLPAQSMRQIGPDAWVFDLGQNMVGVAELVVDEPAGTELTLRHAEMLNPDGSLYLANLRGAPAIDRYTCRGGERNAPETWSPTFTFHGFRYVEVSGLTKAPQLDAVTGLVIGTDLPATGTFACSDERINQLQSNIVWGMRGNMLSIPTDCPQRDERMGWTADTQVFVPTAMYNADIGPFMAKWMRDMRDAQREDGAHSDVAPATRGLNYGTPVWGDAGTIVPWAVYQHSADTRILEENIDSMRRWVDWCAAHSTGLIRDRDRGNDYGDWLSIGADTPKDVIGTAYFARSAWIVASSLDALGREDEANAYWGLFERIRDAFNERYVASDATIEGDTQTCYLIALRFDLLPKRLRPKAAAHLVEDLESRGWRLSTGFVGVSHLLPVLDQAGYPDVAYRLLMQDEFPSWLFSVKHGATTIWERWNGWTPEEGMNDPGMNSFNHFALGSCGEWLFAGIAGIRPDPAHPGFERFFISPRVDGPLTWASATHESVHGTIASSWSNDEDGLTLEITVPANTTATVAIPALTDRPLLESGKPLDRAQGVRVLSAHQAGLFLEVSSGRYRFSAR